MFVQPYIGTRENGVIGGIKGIGKGLASAPVKLLAAAAAPVAYPLKGIDVQVTQIAARRQWNHVIAMKVQQGEHEFLEAGKSEKQFIIDRWNELLVQ